MWKRRGRLLIEWPDESSATVKNGIFLEQFRSRLFRANEDNAMTINPDQQEQYIAIWSKAVDTQMHFNEMSVKSRQLGLTFVAAALGVGIVLLSRGDAFAFPIPIMGYDFQLHIAVILLLGAWLALSAVRGLDLMVYHKMLRGAVTFGEDFEQHYMKQIFDLDKGMTQAISHFSRFEDANKKRSDTGKYIYTGEKNVTAEDKIRSFYKNTIRFVLAGAAALLLITNVPPLKKLYAASVHMAPTSSPQIKMLAPSEASKK